MSFANTLVAALSFQGPALSRTAAPRSAVVAREECMRSLSRPQRARRHPRTTRTVR